MHASASSSCSHTELGSSPRLKRRAIRGWSFSSCSISGMSAFARLSSAIGSVRLSDGFVARSSSNVSTASGSSKKYSFLSSSSKSSGSSISFAASRLSTMRKT